MFVDSLSVLSMTLNSASSFIVPTESTSDNSFKIASIGFFNNFLATIAKLNVNNSLTSFTTTSSIIASPVSNTTFNLCMDGSNMVVGSLFSDLYICGVVQSWNTTWTKMLNGSVGNRVIKGTALISGGTGNILFGYTYASPPYVIASTQGTSSGVAFNQVNVSITNTNGFTVTSPVMPTITISWIAFGI